MNAEDLKDLAEPVKVRLVKPATYNLGGSREPDDTLAGRIGEEFYVTGVDPDGDLSLHRNPNATGFIGYAHPSEIELAEPPAPTGRLYEVIIPTRTRSGTARLGRTGEMTSDDTPPVGHVFEWNGEKVDEDGDIQVKVGTSYRYVHTSGVRPVAPEPEPSVGPHIHFELADGEATGVKLLDERAVRATLQISGIDEAGIEAFFGIVEILEATFQ